jgi:uncharacterized membrane protein
MHILRKISLFFLSLLFFAAGIYHFVNPAFYLGIMPPWLPQPHLLNTIAGIAEMGLAILLWTRWRKAASLLIAMMLVLFFLVHVWHLTPQGMVQVQAPPTLLWVRFAGQFVLITWVWWAGKK